MTLCYKHSLGLREEGRKNQAGTNVGCHIKHKGLKHDSDKRLERCQRVSTAESTSITNSPEQSPAYLCRFKSKGQLFKRLLFLKSGLWFGQRTFRKEGFRTGENSSAALEGRSNCHWFFFNKENPQISHDNETDLANRKSQSISSRENPQISTENPKKKQYWKWLLYPVWRGMGNNSILYSILHQLP